MKRGGGWKCSSPGLRGWGSARAEPVPVRCRQEPADTAATVSASAGVASVPGGDWPTFDFNRPAHRRRARPPRGISARSVRALHLRIVHIERDRRRRPRSSCTRARSAAASRDAVFVTTTYGRRSRSTRAAAGACGSTRRATTRAYAGSAQVTDTTPVADPDRRFIYAVTPDGVVHKLAVARVARFAPGRWPVRITWDPDAARRWTRRSAISGSAVHRRDRRLLRRHADLSGARRAHRPGQRAHHPRLQHAVLAAATR